MIRYLICLLAGNHIDPGIHFDGTNWRCKKCGSIVKMKGTP